MGSVKIELKWAVVFTIIGLVWMYFEKLMGWHDEHIDQHYIFTNLFAIIAIALYVLALLDKRNNYYGGIITYKHAFLSGLILTAFITIWAPLSQYITSTIITPYYFDKVIDYTVENGLKSRQEAESYFNLENYIWQSVIGALIMGIITSALVSIFIRRK
tara:strand:+ start:614 stop:1090 length:477 start_codon:yes stop_codon:yes gene_type:complete